MPEKKKSRTPTVDPQRLMLAYLCIRDVEGLPRQVRILDRFGLSDEEIARVCQAAIGSVRNARHAVKKPKTKRQKTRAAVQAKPE